MDKGASAMSQPAPHVTSSAPAEPVPVAFLGRTSTLLLQEPAASLRRQAREVQAKLPPGWFIAAWFWDIESGGLDLEQRGHGTGHQAVDVDLPRDGGLAALLAEAASPSPRFAAVMCEDIERSGRDTFNALKLERRLGDAGIPLFATDEPINVEGMNATTILIRRVKQGIAEWYRDQLKEKAWRGFEQHAIDGFNIGGVPYGYTPERIPHPNPGKASHGRTKTRLALDPARGPRGRADLHLAHRRQAGRDHHHKPAERRAGPLPVPAPGRVDHRHRVRDLAQPQIHRAYGLRPPPLHRQPPLPHRPPRPMDLVPRADASSDHHPRHLGHRPDHRCRPRQRQDEPGMALHPAARRSYLLRSRCRCRDCKRRMTGRLVRPYQGHPGYVYYDCPHNPANPRHQAAAPAHPRTVRVGEDDLLTVIRQFFAAHIFGPDRAAMLAQRLPASAAEDTARREQETTRLHKRLRKIDAAENAHAREIESLASLPQASPAITALRSRIIERFTELETERTQINDRLTVLDRATGQEDEPGLLDALPMLGEWPGASLGREPMENPENSELGGCLQPGWVLLRLDRGAQLQRRLGVQCPRRPLQRPYLGQGVVAGFSGSGEGGIAGRHVGAQCNINREHAHVRSPALGWQHLDQRAGARGDSARRR
jgi:site-specific DNA recombinase